MTNKVNEVNLQRAEEIAGKYVGFATPTCIALEAEIENALVVAFLKGQQSVLAKMPSTERSSSEGEEG